MDKTAIKNFSIWARNKLIADITYKAGLLGITEEGIKDALLQSAKETEFYDIGTKEPYQIAGDEIKQRRQLAGLIRKKAQGLEYKEAYQNVMEEVAYTWFNRLIAIRFMEVNDYMPGHMRVLSSESGTKLEPDLVTDPFDAGLEFTSEEEQHILKLKNDNAVNELFQFLFIRQCNALNAYLPKLFEKTADYTELLLNVSVTDQDGLVYHLVHDIEEKDFNIAQGGQVEIIGWMYQYYNTEPKDQAFALLKKNVKVTKERIPAVTQLFTPDWIVRYMVENSVGRLWLEGHPDDGLKIGWNYYLDEAGQEADVAEQLDEVRKDYQDIKPEEIKVIDPCMGSGHILVYAFDVLMQIYESYGYSSRDAAKSIVANNLYGLDIDGRAFQLAYFAVMMKARQYSRRILTQGVEPNLCVIQESNGLKMDVDMGDFLLSEEHRETLQYLLDTFVDAKEYGSILEVEDRDYAGFLEAWELTAAQTAGNVVMIMWYMELDQVVPGLAKQAMLLAQKYDAVVTNPPYMGKSGMSSQLSQYIRKKYFDGKTDLYAAMILKCISLAQESKYIAMITQNSWMFQSSFKKFREGILENVIVNMAHLGARAFDEIGGEVVQTTSFVLCKDNCEKYKGTYIRLLDYIGENEKKNAFLQKNNIYVSMCDEFRNLPDVQIAYWVDSKIINLLSEKDCVFNYGNALGGLSTSDNERFLRLWFEVCLDNIKFDYKACEDTMDGKYKWVPHNKGGSFRRWYGNRDYLVNWKNNGAEIKHAVVNNPTDPNTTSWSRRIFNWNYFFKSGITWSDVATGKFSCRIVPEGVIFNATGPTFFVKNVNDIYYFMAYFNSTVFQKFLDLVCPGLHYNTGAVSKLPVHIGEKEELTRLVKDNVKIAKKDWDSFEFSWDFKFHPLINAKSVKNGFESWNIACENRFCKLKENEEMINSIIVKLYGLEDVVSSDISEADISVKKADLQREIKSLLSYAVGCIFGRYSIYKNGICYAGGQWNRNDFSYYASQYFDRGTYPKQLYNDQWLLPNEDNIIPITDEEYFEEDIVSLFCVWLKEVYGKDTLEENLDFIAFALSNKGSTSREVIRNYFLNDFFKEHCAAYSVAGSGKRPIYWLFDSGKQNGFKALIYMHRYNADTIGNLRVDYLHRIERIYESEINRMQDMIDNSNVAREVTVAKKRKEKLHKQLKECQGYDEKIGHLALSRIEIDLDDGVKVNYEKIQTANDGKKYQVLAKI